MFPISESHQHFFPEVELYKTQCGTMAYMAPEVLAGYPYNPFIADIWSIGITLFAMLTVTIPFDTDKDDYGVKEMMNNEWDFGNCIRENASEELMSVMSGLLEPDVSERITTKQLAEHNWLKADYDKARKLEKFLQAKNKIPTASPANSFSGGHNDKSQSRKSVQR